MILPKNIFQSKQRKKVPHFGNKAQYISPSILTLMAFLSSYASYTGPGIIKPTTTDSKFPVSSDFKQSSSSWTRVSNILLFTTSFKKIPLQKNVKLEYVFLDTFIHTVINLTSQKEKCTNVFGVGKWCFVETSAVISAGSLQRELGGEGMSSPRDRPEHGPELPPQWLTLSSSTERPLVTQSFH